MLAKTQFSRDDLLHILSHYDAGEFRQSQSLSSGTVQTNILIETTDAKFVLKYYENRSPGSVHFEVNTLNYILRRKFPCAAPIRKIDDTYFGIFRDKPYVLYQYIEGEHLETLNEQQWSQVIKIAATLQNITKIYRPQIRKHRWNYSPKLCLELAQQKASEIATQNAIDKANWYEAQIAGLDIPNIMPKGICHCDYDLSNILFDDDKFVALIDFDDANITYLIFDLVVLMHIRAWSDETQFDLRIARDVLKEYTRTRTLNTYEKNNIFAVHKLKILFDGIWFFERGQVENFYERRRIEYLDSIGEEAYHQALLG